MVMGVPLLGTELDWHRKQGGSVRFCLEPFYVSQMLGLFISVLGPALILSEGRTILIYH